MFQAEDDRWLGRRNTSTRDLIFAPSRAALKRRPKASTGTKSPALCPQRELAASRGAETAAPPETKMSSASDSEEDTRSPAQRIKAAKPSSPKKPKLETAPEKSVKGGRPLSDFFLHHQRRRPGNVVKMESTLAAPRRGSSLRVTRRRTRRPARLKSSKAAVCAPLAIKV